MAYILYYNIFKEYFYIFYDHFLKQSPDSIFHQVLFKLVCCMAHENHTAVQVTSYNLVISIY